jgi:hypothetical protein
MSRHHEPEPLSPGAPRNDEADIHDRILEEMDPGRREFVKRLLVTTGATVAMITSLSIPEVMANGKKSPGD